MAKAFFITSGRWLRMAPDDSSVPLQTMSYWIALIERIFSWSFASSARNSSTPRFGIENGLWEKSIFFSSSFHSYIGKSTIQQKSKRSLAIRPSSSPTLARARPANLTKSFGLPATKKQASPTPRPSWSAICLVRSGPMFLASGPRRPPRPRARRCSRAPADPRLAPRNSCGRRRRGCRLSAQGSPTPHCPAFQQCARKS